MDLFDDRFSALSYNIIALSQLPESVNLAACLCAFFTTLKSAARV